MAQSANMTATSVSIDNECQHISVIISQLPSSHESVSLMEVHESPALPERLLRPLQP
jgi:hypothetical protein